MSNADAVKKPLSFAFVMIALSWVLSNIGTSNLYTWQEAFGWNYNPGKNLITAAFAVGLYSFVLLYAKYILIGVLRIADDSHSGAVYVYQQIQQKKDKIPKWVFGVVTGSVMISILAVCADGFITGPASVSSALETSRDVIGFYYPIIKEMLSDKIIFGLPKITLIGMSILSLLFFLHRFGPSKFNGLFGPLALLYFGSSLGTGLMLTIKTGGFGILWEALNPFLLKEHFSTVWNSEARNHILGGLFLFFSGFEAAFTDTGLTGRKSMFWAVNVFFLCVIFQYVGQANMLKFGLLQEGAGSPFAQGLLQLPSWLSIEHSTISVMGTIMAAFSLMVAIQHVFYELAEIEWFARLKKKYFGEGEFISYFLNFAQWIGCMAIYGIFQHSANMLAMYGISVCAVLISTGSLIGVRQWLYEKVDWIKYASIVIVVICAGIEIMFFVASLHKWSNGGYVSVLIMIGVLPLILAWIFFEKYKKDRQYIMATSLEESDNLLTKDFGHLLQANHTHAINAVYCRKNGKLTTTDYCAIRELLLENTVGHLYVFSSQTSDVYGYNTRTISPVITEIVRFFPRKNPQNNDDILNQVIGTYDIPEVPITEWGQSRWKPFNTHRGLDGDNGHNGWLFSIGKMMYQFFKEKEEKISFNQPITEIFVPVNTEKH